jgi:hypothetical protein
VVNRQFYYKFLPYPQVILIISCIFAPAFKNTVRFKATTAPFHAASVIKRANGNAAVATVSFAGAITARFRGEAWIRAETLEARSVKNIK